MRRPTIGAPPPTTTATGGSWIWVGAALSRCRSGRPPGLELALRAGELRLSAGASAAEVTASCSAVARAGGLRRVESDITFTSITVAGQPADDAASISGLRLVRLRERDHSRATAVHDVVTELTESRITAREAEHRLLSVAAARHPYRRPVVTGARALLATAVALLLGAGVTVTVAAFYPTVLVGLAIDARGRRGIPTFFQNAAGGLIAMSVALVLVAADLGVRPRSSSPAASCCCCRERRWSARCTMRSPASTSPRARGRSRPPADRRDHQRCRDRPVGRRAARVPVQM